MKPITTKIIDHKNALIKAFLNEAASENFPSILKVFILQQIRSWPRLNAALQNLDQQLITNIFLSELEVQLHHNPQRIKSADAKVDKASIRKRPCFLCPENLYEKQLALSFHENWLILNNPYPIFKDHLVVSSKDHIFQNINDALPAMIKFVQDTDFSFSAFYNGPACGASAPDHLHFQACKKNDLPIIAQINKIIASADTSPLTAIDKKPSSRSFIGTLDNRGIFISTSPDKEKLFSTLTRVISFLKNTVRAADEPLINIVISGSNNTFTAILFPRKTHRPEYFYKEGADKFLISPGAVDISGSIILPRSEDYDRISRENILQVFSEVCLDHSVFKNLTFQGMS